MILKTSQQTTEQTKNIEENSFSLKFLLEHKIEAISQGLLIPDNLIAEIEKFIKRNLLVIDKNNNKSNQYPVCPRCLKAHTIKKAMEIELNEKSISFIKGMFDCESGHNGYYLDNDSLIKT